MPTVQSRLGDLFLLCSRALKLPPSHGLAENEFDSLLTDLPSEQCLVRQPKT